MRIGFFILFFFIFLFACKQQKASVKVAPIGTVSNTANEFTVNGSVTQSHSYCGGARPTDEEYYEMTRPKPLQGATFFIRKGKVNDVNENIIDTIFTDANGNFTTKLPFGDYCIVDHEHLDSSYIKSILKNYSKDGQHYSAANKDCLYNWLASPLTSFHADSAQVINLSWDVHNPCSWHSIPCVGYFGPYPP